MTANPVQARFDQYDVLRGLAIFMVFSVHAGQQFLGESRFSDLNSFLDAGKHGVAFFFFLSGALLAHSLRKVSVSKTNYLKYLLKRLLRIYPAYFISLIVLTVISAPSLQDFLQHLFLVHSLDFRTFGSINYPYWSLSVEFLIYLIIPLLLWLTKDSSRMTALTSLIIISLTWQILGYFARRTVGFDPRNELSATFYVITAIPAFALGVYKLELEKSSKGLKLVKACSMLAVADLLMSFFGIFFEFQFWDPINQLMHGATGYLTYGCLALSLSRKLNEINWTLKILVILSKISYSVYLWHLPIIILCLENYGPSVLSLIMALLITLIVSYLSFRILEKPFIIYSAQNVVLREKIVQ